MAQSKNAARARAFTLYCEGKQQKQIAALVGVTEKTVSGWKLADKWEELRGAATLLGKVPAWGVRMLQLLGEQQTELARLHATVAALNARLAVLLPPA